MNEHLFLSEEETLRDQKKFMVKVYGWMAAALAITGLVAFYTASTESMMLFIFQNKWVFIGLLITKLFIVGGLSIWIRKLSAPAATALFVLYSVLTGFVFAGLFFMYTFGSLASTFLITAGLFAVMSAYGYFTGNDLTKLGSILIMLLIGLIIATIVNIFLNSPALYWITTYVGIFIFTGLIAYDTQKLKDLQLSGSDDSEETRKVAIIGAFSLYLDFINLFLMLLRLFGRRN